jgi:hypothetical protein
VKKLDFVIVGTFKSATSSLAFQLQAHSDVNIPHPKDPYIFLKEYCSTLEKPEVFLKDHHKSAIYDDDEFDQSFDLNKNSSALCGEATPLYLYKHEEAIKNIKANNPDMKIIIVLRDPAQRAFSNYMHNIKDGFEERTFSEAIEQYRITETENVHPFFHYIKAGFYYQQVKAYLNAFDNVHIVLYDDISSDPEAVMSSIYSFLKIENKPQNEKIARLNKTGIIKNKKLHKFILQESGIKSILRPIYRFFIRDVQKRKRISEKVKNRNIAKPFLNAKDKEAMSVLYSEDIKALSKLLNISLDKSWSN